MHGSVRHKRTPCREHPAVVDYLELKVNLANAAGAPESFVARPTVLIAGAGIAGPALAQRLLSHGFRPTLVERAPALRTSGYVIDFWGKGYDVVESMGLRDQVLSAGYKIREVRIVDEEGKKTGGFDAGVFRAAAGDRFTSLRRSDLSAILFKAIDDRVETIWGDSVVALDDGPQAVRVTFERAPAREFDLVVGADGLHSKIRELTFGPEGQFEFFLRYVVGAFECAGYEPRDPDIYVAHAAPGKQVARFAMRDGRTMFLLIAVDDGRADSMPRDLDAQKAFLQRRFAYVGWECPRILTALQTCDEVYLDRVSQIRMPHWSQGRVCLIGDAAFAPSLLAGQGAALAIIAADVLAGELARHASHSDAFRAYERLLRPIMERKQRAAVRTGSAFAPRTRLGIELRNLATKLLRVPSLARLSLRGTFDDDVQIPDYGELAQS